MAIVCFFIMYLATCSAAYEAKHHWQMLFENANPPNRRNILITSMNQCQLNQMLLAVSLNFLVFSVYLDDMMDQSVASLVPTAFI
jgi:hypothetical protein